MLDKWALAWTKPALEKTADIVDKTGVTANQVSIIGFLVGILVVPALWVNMYLLALAIIIANRALDGLDGTLARLGTPTDAGGFLDITLDFIFYSAVIWGFALSNPEQNALAAATLIFAFIGPGSSFLAFAVMAARRNIKSVRYPQKGLYYLEGLTEGTETIIFLVLFCLLPDYFPILAYVFAALCWLTTLIRIVAGYQTLLIQPQKSEEPK
ncbi:MAG: CDP-alcohol phosphatidyltransferase family protein [Deltaproteobacteria bacterium]|nr:CDP-alcohol phosphatidyltransferase family protein [Deltaproteobacteria bacterium]